MQDGERHVQLGKVMATPNLVARLAKLGPQAMVELAGCVERHRHGDWGDMDGEDWATNDHALARGYRLLSHYQVCGQAVWIITEADRATTTLLLPEDY